MSSLVTTDPSSDTDASWSPDRAWIAFESRASEDGPASLWLVAVEPGICSK